MDFQTTHWSVVLAARTPKNHPPVAEQAGEADSALGEPPWRIALQQLAETYWYPLYAYLRRRGNSPEDASDLTQGFFAALMEKNYLDAVDPENGKFRWFLMHAMKRYAANERKARTAQKRGGATTIHSLHAGEGERRYLQEPVDLDDPQRLFLRRWAMTVLQNAMDDVHEELAAQDATGRFAELVEFIAPGAKNGYAEVAERLNMTTGAVKVAVHRLRDRFRRQLRLRIAQTLESNNDDAIDRELDELFAALA